MPQETTIESLVREFRLFWGYAPEGSPKYRKGKDVEFFIITALRTVLLEVRKEIEEGKKVYDPEDEDLSDPFHVDGYNTAKDADIAIIDNKLK